MSRGIFDGRRGGNGKLNRIIACIFAIVVGFAIFKAGNPILGVFLMLGGIGAIFIG